MLKTVTVTGADDSTNIDQMVQIQQDFPFVEWAILVSAKRVSPRFPSLEWIEKLRGRKLKLSLHLCGRYVNDLLLGDLDLIMQHLNSIWNMFDRVQINTHGIPHIAYLQAMAVVMNNFQGKEFIFQYDNENTEIVDYASKCGVNCSALFDLSHGDGILPTQWPSLLPEIKCGYAGGLSPENVSKEIEKIKTLVGNSKIWIDAETHLRSRVNGNDIFDLDKVRKFLSEAKPYIS